MPVWRFSPEQNWYLSKSHTLILPVNKEGEEDYKEAFFVWPSWAIKMVNDMLLNNCPNAIKEVSKLLEQERKQHAFSN